VLFLEVAPVPLVPGVEPVAEVLELPPVAVDFPVFVLVCFMLLIILINYNKKIQ
jgi:hypothetical protein